MKKEKKKKGRKQTNNATLIHVLQGKRWNERASKINHAVWNEAHERWNGHNFQSIRINFLNPGSHGTHAALDVARFTAWLRFLLGLHVTNSSQQIGRREHERSNNLDNTVSIDAGRKRSSSRDKSRSISSLLRLFFLPLVSGGERRSFFEIVDPSLFFFYLISVERKDIFLPESTIFFVPGYW